MQFAGDDNAMTSEDEEEVVQWLRNSENFEQPEFQPASRPGPVREIPPDKTPFDIFQLFFSVTMLTKIINATHSFALQMKSRFPLKHKMTWTKPSLSEMWAFLGLCLLIGIVRKSKLKDYWLTNRLLAMPIFKKNEP